MRVHPYALAGLDVHIEDTCMLVVEQQLVRLRGNPGRVLCQEWPKTDSQYARGANALPDSHGEDSVGDIENSVEQPRCRRSAYGRYCGAWNPAAR
jgi:hypothetical protein